MLYSIETRSLTLALAFGWSSDLAVDLADCTHVIRQMRDAADHAAQLDAVDLSRRAQNHQPSRALIAELNAERLPLRLGDGDFFPARRPVGIGERVLTLAPAVHQRQAIDNVRD